MTSLFTNDAEGRQFIGSGSSRDLEPSYSRDIDEPMGAPVRQKRQPGELDMTPMVDVTFLLLIFFMVTASFSLQKSIQMPRQASQLPSPTPMVPDPLELDVIELHINERGSFLVLARQWQRESPGKQSLISALIDAAGDDPARSKLDIRVHEDAKLQILVDAIDAANTAGIAEIQVTEVDGETLGQA